MRAIFSCNISYANKKFDEAMKNKPKTLFDYEEFPEPIKEIAQSVENIEVVESNYEIHPDVLNNAKKYWDQWMIPSVRRDVNNNTYSIWKPWSFWNPFDFRAVWWVRKATQMYYQRLKWTNYQNKFKEYRNRLIEQIKNWSLKWKKIVYYTDKIDSKYNDYGVELYDEQHPNHAMVLQRFINGEYTIWQQQQQQEEQKILEKVTPETLPEVNEMVAKDSVKNETIAKQNLWDPQLIKNLVNDCEELWLVLDSLEPEVLWQVIAAYKHWKWIDDVIKYFADLMPGSYVDNKITQMLIKKWIVTDQKYNWLTLSEMIAWNYAKKKIDEWNMKVIERLLKKWETRIWYEWRLYWIKESKQPQLLLTITDYYIQNYLNLNPEKVSPDFRNKFASIVEQTL